MNEYLIQLARERSFSELQPQDRAAVLAEMSEEEYTLLRKTLRSSVLLDANAMPPAGLRQALMERYRTSRPTPIWRKPVPVWQAAAAMALLAAAMFLWKNETVIERVVTNREVISDTVFVEKLVWRDRVVTRERMVYREKTLPTQAQANVSAAPPDSTQANGMAVGASLGDLPDLFRFFNQAEE